MTTTRSVRPITDAARAAWASIDPADVVRDDLEIAGLHVRMEVAGEALGRVLRPALELHPRIATGDADLAVRAYDSEATGAALPPLGRAAHRLAQWPGEDGLVRTAWQPDHGLALLTDPGPEGVGHLAASASAARLPWWEPGSPLRQLLAWGMRGHGRHFLHAAAVGGPQGVVLLAAAGGAGKSSTAVSCLLAGLGYLADDYCIVTLAPEGPRAHALYGTAKLVREQLHLVDPHDELGPHHLPTGASPDGKVTIVVSRWPRGRLVRDAPILAVAVPSQAEPRGFQPMSAATALRHLAPTSLFQLAGHGAEDLRAIADLVRRVPCYRLGLDPDRAANPEAIGRFLHDAGVPDP